MNNTLNRNRDHVLRWLVERLAAELEIDARTIDISAPFATFGVSSITGVALSGDIADTLGVDIAPTVLWDYPTIERLVDYLVALARDPGLAA